MRRLGKAEPSYRKVTFHKEHLELDQHLDAILIGPGLPLYAAVDERLNEMLSEIAGSLAVYLDEAAEASYRLHFFEIAIRGQSTKGNPQTLHGELVAVREDIGAPIASPERFAVVPADALLDLPTHPSPPASIEPLRIRNPVKHLDHVKRKVVTARYYDIATEAIEQAAHRQEGNP